MNLPLPELESRLYQFNKLMQELLRGRIQRNTFQSWEVEILLDIEACELRDANRREVLRRYQRAANKYVDRGGRSLLKLSEYLEKKHRQPIGGAAAAAPAAAVAEDDEDGDEDVVVVVVLELEVAPRIEPSDEEDEVKV